MTRAPRNPRLKDYQVGYGKPPCHTRFRPGVSGNPGGRPRGASAGRADRLALKEIYRLIAVREGEQTQTLTTLQAVVRQLGRVALKGNGPTLRAYLGIAQAHRASRRDADSQSVKREDSQNHGRTARQSAGGVPQADKSTCKRDLRNANCPGRWDRQDSYREFDQMKVLLTLVPRSL